MSGVRNDAELCGYAHPAYAVAVAAGRPVHTLHGSGGRVIERPIPHVARADLAGPYPLFACADWNRLQDDLNALPAALTSVTLVADPFGEHSAALLARTFPDLCRPYKEHFVTDLQVIERMLPSAHHRRNVRRAAGLVEVEVCAHAPAVLDTWTALYATLTARHAIRGDADFSRASFAAQLAVPGLVALRALRAGETVGMTLWYEQADVAYYHLGAYSAAGYAHRAAYALFRVAISHFRGRVAWLSLGAGAGVEAGREDGLTRFKRGWSTGTRMAYLCGRVLDRRAYRALSATTHDNAFFPAYRAPCAESRELS